MQGFICKWKIKTVFDIIHQIILDVSILRKIFNLQKAVHIGMGFQEECSIKNMTTAVTVDRKWTLRSVDVDGCVPRMKIKSGELPEWEQHLERPFV